MMSRTSSTARRRRVATKPSSAIRPKSKKVIVEFPDALYAETRKAVEELAIKRSVFLRDAVREYLKLLQRRKLVRELADGYRANAGLNRKISEEFQHVDAENL